MGKDKKEATRDYIEIVKNSWTFAKLTTDEKNKILDILKFSIVRGTYQERHDILNQLYNCFLQALGFEGCGIGWRETKEEAETMPRF
jgi:hypothetical protein